MGGIISGAALPAMADLGVRATTLPLMLSLWSDGRWGWSLAFFLIWHFVVFVPSLGFGLDSSPYTQLQADGTSTFYAYYLYLPALAAACAFIGAVLPSWLALPRHLFPWGHLFSLGNRGSKISDRTRVSCSYAMGAAVAAFLGAMASWLPYELVVLLVGGDNYWCAIVGCAAPAVAFLFPLIPLVACGARSEVTQQQSAGIVFLKLLLVAVLCAATPMTAYFARDFDWTWLTGCLVAAAVFGAAAVFYCVRGETEEKEERIATHGKHATDLVSARLTTYVRA